MSSACEENYQKSLFSDLGAPDVEGGMLQWEIEIDGERYMVKGKTQKEAFAEVGRAIGSHGQPETCYRHALRRKPVVVSKTPVRFLK